MDKANKMSEMRERRNMEKRMETEISMQKLQKEMHNWKNYSEEFKQKSIAIFYEGHSSRAVGRMMGINKSTVYNWIKKLDEKLQGSIQIKEKTKNESNQ